MTPWTLTGSALVVLVGVAMAAVVRGTSFDRLIGLHLMGVMLPMVFVVVAIVSGRAIYLDVAVVLAVLSFAGGLGYAQLLERWL